jgi:hypothetical protein
MEFCHCLPTQLLVQKVILAQLVKKVNAAKEIHEVLQLPTYPITRSESDISSVS